MTYSGIDITNKGIPWKYEYIIDTLKCKAQYKHMTPFNINNVMHECHKRGGGRGDRLGLGTWPIYNPPSGLARWVQPLHQK